MTLELLSIPQIKQIYQERMKIDFPPDELKPLAMILKVIEEGIYKCYGLVDDEEILGYVYMKKLIDSEDYLIDYLAVRTDVRNQGLGAIMIRLLGETLQGASSIIGEVEDPAYAKNAKERDLRHRRYGFYMRNGFRDTSVKVRCFGVPFIIIEMGEGIVHTENQTKELYQMQYRTMLPKAMYEKNIRIF